MGVRSDDGSTMIRPNLGTNRRLIFRDLSIGPEHCMLELPTPGLDGYMTFYTDPTCTELCSGPSANCIKQTIHNSFTGFNISGVFDVSDVHGVNVYQSSELPDGSRISGLRGIVEIERGLSRDA